MITPAYVAAMTTYNAAMNARLYAASARLSEDARRQDRGAFWTSIHGTLSHLLWADVMWMSRFDGWRPPARRLAESDREYPDFPNLQAERVRADATLTAWAKTLDTAWLEQDQLWHSGAANRDMRMPRALLLMHLFNHQTHHRGQVHAMLTAAGETTGDTDLWLVVPTATTGGSEPPG